MVGGLSQLCTLIKIEKNKTKNCIVTLNGDFLSASVLAYKYKGSHMIDILNKMPYDVITLGNHECKFKNYLVDFGASTLIEKLKEFKSTITILNSNIFIKKTNKILEGTKEKMIIKLDSGLLVGLFAVCTKNTNFLSKPGGNFL
jgi:2',3'-cyclic-nucleotide 2'-phosphodiesterase (5'-nucleotidase family)